MAKRTSTPPLTSCRAPVVNTATQLLHPFDALPESVAASESRGAAQIVASEQIPVEGLAELLPIMQLAGFTFPGLRTVKGVPRGSKDDELFVDAVFPKGWTRRRTEHAMHTDILDEKGRKRFGVFYKAAFYDRKAGIHACHRVHIRCRGFGPDYNNAKDTRRWGMVEIDDRVVAVVGPVSREKYWNSCDDAETLACAAAADLLVSIGYTGDPYAKVDIWEVDMSSLPTVDVEAAIKATATA